MKDEAPAPTGASPEASPTDSPLDSLLSNIVGLSDERRDEILAKLPEEKRQKMIAALGSIRWMSPADIEAAVAHDREWSAGLPRWKSWVARLILAATEKLFRSGTE